MRTLFLDVDTQLDFLYPAGALYVPGAEQIVPAIAALNRYAMSRGIPLLSTVDAHTEDDPEFKTWPAHCVAGSLGHLVMKAIKRDRGIPSWGAEAVSVTGTGGLLDRVDALCFAAPVFFHSVRWFFDL